MINAGFYGGSLINGLGPTSDMKLFFNSITMVTAHLPKNSDKGLLTDRFYRRYLRLNDLDSVAALLAQTREIMKDIQTKDVNLENLGWNPDLSKLNRTDKNFSKFLEIYLDAADEIVSEARGFEKMFHIYKPVITIITNTPRFYVERTRPLAEYDSLEGDPMWLR